MSRKRRLKPNPKPRKEAQPPAPRLELPQEPATPPAATFGPPWLLPALALLVVAVAYFTRLDAPLLWGDEADTGVEARNILKVGYPLAFDGRNVSIYDDGSQLNEHLVCNKIPWCQYYLGAASLLLFGQGTAGLRALFALCGALTFFPVYALLKPRVRFPAFTTMLILTAPQIVLFQRNARYYPLLILIYAVLVWHLSQKFKNRAFHFLSAAVLFVLLFQTHPFAALCASLSVVLYALAFRRDVLVSYLVASAVGCASWQIWFHVLGPPLAGTDLSLNTIGTDFALWFLNFVRGLWAAFIDPDAVGCFPLLVCAVLLAVLAVRQRWGIITREPLFAFIFLNIAVQAVVTAAVFGTETQDHLMWLRYEPHLLIFGLLALFLLLDAIAANAVLYFVVGAGMLFCNFATLSYWTTPHLERTPATWFVPVYTEIVRPPPETWNEVVDSFRNMPENAAPRDTMILTLPVWTSDVTNFYLGDRYLIMPILYASHAAKADQAMRAAMGPKAFARLQVLPAWIVDLLGQITRPPPNYILTGTYPRNETRPDDGARPELLRHSFAAPAALGNITVFRLQDRPTHAIAR